MAIHCYSSYGPTFGDSDIVISNMCDQNDYSSIYYGGIYGCKDSSILVGTPTSSGKVFFQVLDYEVYCIDYKNKHTIEHLCKHPDIVWEYIQTKDISEESLKQFDDANELLNDLDTIYCEDNNIRLKISKCCLKNPSELLPNTQLVDKKYDSSLREWLGSDYQWRLIYRSSEHGYTGKSFHEYCDDKGPTLIIIKSSEGWIFGGYTTQSWSGVGIDYDRMIMNR